MESQAREVERMMDRLDCPAMPIAAGNCGYYSVADPAQMAEDAAKMYGIGRTAQEFAPLPES